MKIRDDLKKFYEIMVPVPWQFIQKGILPKNKRGEPRALTCYVHIKHQNEFIYKESPLAFSELLGINARHTTDSLKELADLGLFQYIAPRDNGTNKFIITLNQEETFLDKTLKPNPIFLGKTHVFLPYNAFINPIFKNLSLKELLFFVIAVSVYGNKETGEIIYKHHKSVMKRFNTKSDHFTTIIRNIANLNIWEIINDTNGDIHLRLKDSGLWGRKKLEELNSKEDRFVSELMGMILKRPAVLVKIRNEQILKIKEQIHMDFRKQELTKSELQNDSKHQFYGLSEQDFFVKTSDRILAEKVLIKLLHEELLDWNPEIEEFVKKMENNHFEVPLDDLMNMYDKVLNATSITPAQAKAILVMKLRSETSLKEIEIAQKVDDIYSGIADDQIFEVKKFKKEKKAKTTFKKITETDSLF